MIYRDLYGDLFDAPDDHTLAQCISADFGMGKGIAVRFNEKYDMKNIVMQQYGVSYLEEWDRLHKTHGCILVKNVLNLITKRRYYDKPTYQSLAGALEDAKIECVLHGIQKVSMPEIGCGLDRLNFDKVKNIIKDVFDTTSIEINVYHLDQRR